MCGNYTVQVTGGNMDTALIERRWRDEVTGVTHQNVFALGSPCSFPSTLNENDEFIFTIDTSPVSNCVQCMAYYPTPSKKLSIKVLPGACNQ